MRSLKEPGLADALFRRLADPGRALAPSWAITWQADENLRATAARASVRPWLERWLTAPPRPQLQVLAIILLAHAWRSGDEALLDPLTRSESVYVRRAAFRALFTKAPALADTYYPKAAADAAAPVRLTVCAQFQGEAWTHEFDEQDSASAYASMSTGRRTPGPAARAALERLAGDPDVRVAMASQLALLQAGLWRDAAATARTLRSLPDRSLALAQVSDAIRSSGKALPDLASLLPLLEEGEQDEDDRQMLRRLLLPAGATAAATQAVAVAAAPAGPVRAYFFVEAGCEACARARLVLDQVRPAFPDLQLTELEIVRVDARELNRALCDHFHAPGRIEGLTPTLFAGAGYLSGESNFVADRVVDLFARSLGCRFDFALKPSAPAAAPEPAPAPAPTASIPAASNAVDLAAAPVPPAPAVSLWPVIAAGVAGALVVLGAARLRRRPS